MDKRFLSFAWVILIVFLMLGVASAVILNCNPNPAGAESSVDCVANELGSGDVTGNIEWYDSMSSLKFTDSCSNTPSCTSTKSPNSVGEWTIKYVKGSERTNTTLYVVTPNICGNGIIDTGEECDDGNTDNGDGCSSGCLIEYEWYQDFDEDGFGDASTWMVSPSQPTGYVADNTDCNDKFNSIYPGAMEIPEDEIDQDCNGIDAKRCYQDLDQDGYGSDVVVAGIDGTCNGDYESGISGDCNDNDATKNVDCVAPIVTLYTPEERDVYSSQVPLSFMFTDAVTTEIMCSIYVNGQPNWGFGATSGTVLNGGIGICEGFSDGPASLFVSCIDGAGNEGLSKEISFLLDRTAPETTATAITTEDEETYISGEWTNQDVEITLECSDALSDCTIKYLINGVGQTPLFPTSMGLNILLEPTPFIYERPFSIEIIGENVITYWSVDGVGNEEDKKTFEVKIDKTPPELIDEIYGELADEDGTEYEFGTWTPMCVYIDFGECDDLLSGCEIKWLVNEEEQEENGLTDFDITVCETGIHKLTYWAIDGAGNEGDRINKIVKITASGINGYWEFPEGSTPDSAEWIELHEELDILLSDGSRIFLPAGTRITRTDGENLDLSVLTYSDENASFLEGFEDWRVAEGALQFGIPSLGLEFSTPITIKIFVGTDLDGQTLDIMRSVSGSDGWTNEGIVEPKTCVVTLGFCEFQTTLASYFVTTSGSAPATTSSGGGGGSSWWYTWGTTCDTQWTCTEWGACVDGTQTRTCSYPAGVCASTSAKPAESQSCNAEMSEIETPAEETQTVTPGITGAVIGNLSSTQGIGIIIVIAAVLVAGIVLIKRTSGKKGKKKSSEKD